MKSYPSIMSELATLANCELKSIARFVLMLSADACCAAVCTSQRPNPKLAAELRVILQAKLDACMVGIPNAFHPDAPRAVCG